MQLSDVTRLFPAVIAPAIVAHLRRRWPAIDGLLVWLVVVGVAVLLSLGIAALNGQPFALATIRDGVILGLAAASIDTVANGKPSAKPAADAAAPAAPDTIAAAPPLTPENTGVRPVGHVVEASEAWGPLPSARGR